MSVSLGRVTTPGDGAGGKAVIREKSEGTGCSCICAHTHRVFCSEILQHASHPPLPIPPHHRLVLTPASYSSSSDAQQAPNCFSWVSVSSPPAGSQRGGLSSLLSSLRRGNQCWLSLPSRLRQQPRVSVSPGCIDMLSIEGQFTFTADQPQLHCATFFIGEPEELITIDYDFVNIDCQGGDFLKVRSWWVLLPFPFPALIWLVWCLLRVEGAGECVCARVCLCVCVCAEQSFTKQLPLGWLFLLPEALWVCPPASPPP